MSYGIFLGISHKTTFVSVPWPTIPALVDALKIILLSDTRCNLDQRYRRAPSALSTELCVHGRGGAGSVKADLPSAATVFPLFMLKYTRANVEQDPEDIKPVCTASKHCAARMRFQTLQYSHTPRLAPARPLKLTTVHIAMSKQL